MDHDQQIIGGGQDDTVYVESVESVHDGPVLPMKSAGL